MDAFQAGAGVQQGDQTGPAAGKIAGQEQRIILAGHAVTGVRTVGPVDENPDHRIVDRAEVLNRLVRSG